MTSAEWAAWLQAVGTIVAILAAAVIAIWQSNKQHKIVRSLHKEEQRHNRVEMAKTLLALCRNCTKAVKHFTTQIHSQEAIHNIAEGETYFDFGELQTLENGVVNIPLYSLPDTLVTHAMILGSTVRQFRHKVDSAVRFNRQMDAEAFDDLFKVFSEMNKSLELTCKDIEVEVEHIQQDA